MGASISLMPIATIPAMSITLRFDVFLHILLLFFWWVVATIATMSIATMTM